MTKVTKNTVKQEERNLTYRPVIVRFEVVTAVTVEIVAIWGVTQRNLLEMNRRFGGTFCRQYGILVLDCTVYRRQQH